MLRKFHVAFGLTAGVVLAIMALSGSLMALQPQILGWLNPASFAAPGRGAPLTALELHQQARRQYPGQRIQALTLPGQPGEPAVITLAVPGKPRGKAILVNPWTAAPLPPRRGESFFHLIEDIHRKLLAGEVGERLTSLTAFLLPVMLLTGLLMRLRRWPGLRAWFLPRAGGSPRARTWHWHAVLGSWLSLTLLFSAMTGLWWSFDGWKQGLQALLGAEAPAQVANTGISPVGTTMLATHLDAAQAQLASQLPKAYRSLSIDLDRMGQGHGLVVEYVLPDARHARERNLLIVSASGDLKTHQRYADTPYGQRLAGAWKLVHTGQFWGLPGQLLLLASGLGTVLLFVLGLRLFLTRSR